MVYHQLSLIKNNDVSLDKYFQEIKLSSFVILLHYITEIYKAKHFLWRAPKVIGANHKDGDWRE